MTEAKKPRTAAVKELVLFMKEHGVAEFTVGDVFVKFDTFGQMKKPVPLDDKEAQAQHIRELLKSDLENEQADLLWSAQP